MIFSSTMFVFGFLPFFLVVYYLTPRAAKSLVILLGSYAFYAWWRVDYLAVVFGLSLVSYLAAHFALSGRSEQMRAWAVRLGVGFVLLVLGYFKYTLFVLGGLRDMAQIMGGEGLSLPQIILPIGISFHAFQCISYIVDVARKDAPPARRLVDFLAFGSLFPQLIAGPVLRYKDLADQFQHRTHSVEKFANGLTRFAQGLAMKVLVADNVAPLADRMFTLSSPTAAEAWLGTGAYTVQLFFDFAGYSAMAIGLGLMMGFQFIENFDAPYTSRSITEFWRRWHISLSHWLRDYLYVPLGGNRHGTWRTYRNLMLTMVLGGLWHGANWTFVLWGAWHGCLLAMERMIGARGKASAWPKALAWPLTMVLVMIGWVLFRAPDLGQAAAMYRGMLGLQGGPLSAETAWQVQNTEVAALMIGAAVAIAGKPLMKLLSAAPIATQRAGVAALLGFSCTALIAQTDSPFLYFQF